MKKHCLALALLLLTLHPAWTQPVGAPGVTPAGSPPVATPGNGVELVFTPYSTTIFADGTDRCDVVISVLDRLGNEVRTVNAPLSIVVQGKGRIVPTPGIPGTELRKGDASTWETALVNGVSRFTLISDSADRIKIEVRSAGLRSASSEIHSIKPFPLLTPARPARQAAARVIPKMLGADISNLPQMESRGIKFSENGVEKDALEILKSHGFNAIRLRLFHNPAAQGGYSRQGFCGLEQTKLMAARIKKAGMYFLLDFHYSDYWADPQQQNKPSAWKDLSGPALETALREYTRDVIRDLKALGAAPDMVQVGNEINHGMVWPDGHIGNPDQLAGLIRAGIQGVREADPSILIMVHVALGGQQKESVFWLDNMFARGVECDIIGLSYYPRWHGTLQDLDQNMRLLAERYQKDINLVEYSHKKQEVHDIVFNLPNNRGRGSFIWEPLNTWEQIFDREGKPNDLIRVYDGIAAKYLK